VNLCKAAECIQPRARGCDDSPMAAPTRLGFTVSETARHLGVSISTVRRWSDAGHLHGYRTPGGQRRFTREQLDDFMRSLEGDRREAPSISS